MADAPAVLVCIRCADARTCVPGSFRVACSACCSDCWRSPSSSHVPPGTRVLCLTCACRELGDGEPVEIAPLTEAQVAEIVASCAVGES